MGEIVGWAGENSSKTGDNLEYQEKLFFPRVPQWGNFGWAGGNVETFA